MCSDLPAPPDRRLRCCGASGLGFEVAVAHYWPGPGLWKSRGRAVLGGRLRLIAGMQYLPANENYRPGAGLRNQPKNLLEAVIRDFRESRQV